jgi:hypothetical protein
MNTILSAWLQSLSFFSPQRFFTSCIQAFMHYVRAVRLLVKYFFWLIVLDIFIGIIFGNTIAKTIITLMSNPQATTTPSVLITFVYITSEIIWFIIITAFLLFIRCHEIPENPLEYFKHTFFQYMYLLLLTSLLFFFCIILLMGLGITKFPSQMIVTTILSIIMYGIKFFTIFFWLDTTPSIKTFIHSIESSANLLLYNLPLFIILGGISFGYFMFSAHVPTFTTIISSKGLEHPPLFFLIGGKYLLFLIENFFLSLLFIIYEQKKHTFVHDQNSEHD